MVPLILVTLFVVAGIVALVFWSHSKGLKLTSSTTGQVIASEVREVRDSQQRREETVIRCRYEVAGRAFDVQRIVPGRYAAAYPVGLRLEVRYNPAEPSMAEVVV